MAGQRIPSESLWRAALQSWPEIATQPDLAAFPITTGLSDALLWRITAAEGDYCLRGWPIETHKPELLQAIHRLQQHLDAHNFSLSPVCVPLRPGTTFCKFGDYHWELSNWLPGETSYAFTPTAAKRSAAMTALAEFHLLASDLDSGLPANSIPSPGLALRASILHDLTKDKISSLNCYVRDSPRHLPFSILGSELLDLVAKHLPDALRLLDNFSRTPLPMQWCLRDVHQGNFLFEGDRVTGLLDFGAAAVDSVAGDLARLIRSLAEGDVPLWRECLTIYHQLTPLSVEQRRAVAVFDRAGILCSAVNWLRWLFVEKRAFEPQQVEPRLELLCQRLSELDASLASESLE